MKRIIYALMICVSFNLTGANAQQIDEQNKVFEPTKQSKFRNLFDKKGAIVVTEEYEIESYRNNGLNISANVGWIEGEAVKIYAAKFSDIYVDFEQLTDLQNNLEKFIRKVEQSDVENKVISIRYISPHGIFINYYTFKKDDGSLWRNVYFKYGNFVSQERTLATVKRFSSLIAQTQEKLISLGAKQQSVISKK